MNRPWLKAADVALALAVAVLACLPLFLRGESTGTVEIYQDGERVYTLSLAEETAVTVHGVTVTVSGGAAFMSDADCPDRCCMAFGRLTKAGDTAVCLPNRVTVTLSGSDADGVTY